MESAQNSWQKHVFNQLVTKVSLPYQKKRRRRYPVLVRTLWWRDQKKEISIAKQDPEERKLVRFGMVPPGAAAKDSLHSPISTDKSDKSCYSGQNTTQKPRSEKS